MSKRNDIQKIAEYNPIVRHGWTLYQLGMPFEDALCVMVIALSDSNQKLTKELIAIHENAPDARFILQELYRHNQINGERNE